MEKAKVRAEEATLDVEGDLEADRETLGFQIRFTNELQTKVNPQPSTLNPQPSTLNPRPSTLSPQPSTLNPEP